MTNPKVCGKCGDRPAGPGGVLCPECTQTIEQALNDVWLPNGLLDTPAE